LFVTKSGSSKLKNPHSAPAKNDQRDRSQQRGGDARWRREASGGSGRRGSPHISNRLIGFAERIGHRLILAAQQRFNFELSA
jgi:hypothetical protein